MKKHNFYAGPSILSEYTIKNTAAAVENFAGMGLSLLEISHRSKEFVAVNDEARALIKELLDIPAGYEVVFLGGGASMQFCMVPYNLLNKKASYLDTGTWSSKAIKEAKLFGEVEVVASSKDKNYTYIPKDYTIADDADYFHITTNNTIYGTETRKDPDVKQRLVADMSSDIFSRPIDVSKYDIIYAGAQKNLAPAGVTLAIVRVDALGHVERPIPTMLNYKTHVDKDSMFNTPPVLPIYAALQTLKWYKEQGGVAAMEKKDMENAAILYDEIDRNKLFRGTVAAEDRSIMNVCFVMNDEYKELEDEFSKFAAAAGMVGIKGHRSVGGFRASLYNAMPKSSVEALVACMKDLKTALIMAKILVATDKPFAAIAVKGIREVVEGAGDELILLEKYGEKAKLLEAVKDVDAIIIRSDVIDAEVLDAAKQLKIVVRAGAGYDNVDLAAATAHNVCVMNTPGQNSNAVAELAFGMMVMAVRNFYNGTSGTELKGKKLGIHAYGNVGRNVARIAKGFGMEIYAFDAFCPASAIEADGVKPVASPEELYATCDIVSLHIPATAETKNSINYALVGKMPKGGLLVNTARKEVINEAELIKLMEERADLKYVTDIMPVANEEFAAKFAGRYFSTPKKMGAQTAEANINAGIAAAKQIEGFLKEGCEKFRVNK